MHDVRCTAYVEELEGEQSWRSTNPANIDPGWGGAGGGSRANMGEPAIKNAACGTNHIIITSVKWQNEPLIFADDAWELLNKFNIVFVIFSCFFLFFFSKVMKNQWGNAERNVQRVMLKMDNGPSWAVTGARRFLFDVNRA